MTEIKERVRTVAQMRNDALLSLYEIRSLSTQLEDAIPKLSGLQGVVALDGHLSKVVVWMREMADSTGIEQPDSETTEVAETKLVYAASKDVGSKSKRYLGAVKHAALGTLIPMQRVFALYDLAKGLASAAVFKRLGMRDKVGKGLYALDTNLCDVTPKSRDERIKHGARWYTNQELALKMAKWCEMYIKTHATLSLTDVAKKRADLEAAFAGGAGGAPLPP